MSSYTINPGRQIKLESKKGYWFPAFFDSSISQDTSYADFTDSERYIRHTLNLSATGYILAPNVDGGKVGLKSIVSAPKISFDVMTNYTDLDPIEVGVRSNDPNAKILDELISDDGYQVGQQSGVPAIRSLENLFEDKSKSYVVTDNTSNSEDVVGNLNSEHVENKKVIFKDEDGNIIPIVSQNQNTGETVYDQKYAEVIFNISNNDK